MKMTKANMLYDDGNHYKWKAAADHDNPYYRGGTDHSELNRTEGYEVLYFINHLAGTWRWTNSAGELVEPTLSSLQKIEKMIRYHVPTPIRKREQIAAWILSNWKNVS